MMIFLLHAFTAKKYTYYNIHGVMGHATPNISDTRAANRSLRGLSCRSNLQMFVSTLPTERQSDETKA